MKLYLIRHSNAVEPGTSEYEDDSQRPLTEKGREKMRKIASALKDLGIAPDLILSSPFVRAAQTAEILAKIMKYKKDIACSESLIPVSNTDTLIGEINEKYTVDELVLVGHEPSLSALVGTLTGAGPEIAINLKNGGVCCLSADDLHVERKAVLEWLLTPKILSRLS
jgi:phosphohistidine phosphatase